MKKQRVFFVMFIFISCFKSYSQNDTNIPQFDRDSSIISRYKLEFFSNSNNLIYIYKLGNGIKNLMMLSYNDTSINRCIIIKFNTPEGISVVQKNTVNLIYEECRYNTLNHLIECIDTSKVICCDIPIYLMVITNKENKIDYSGYFINPKEYSCRDCFVLIDKIKTLLK